MDSENCRYRKGTLSGAQTELHRDLKHVTLPPTRSDPPGSRKSLICIALYTGLPTALYSPILRSPFTFLCYLSGP